MVSNLTTFAHERRKITTQKKISFSVIFALLAGFFWYWCYYPHRVRDSLSPVCGIFKLTIKLVDVTNIDLIKWVSQKLSALGSQRFQNGLKTFCLNIDAINTPSSRPSMDTKLLFIFEY